jgi:hypothetical protein
MASKERLELDKNMAKADEALRARELTITEEKNKKEANKKWCLNKLSLLLFDSGNAKEIKNNF